MTGTEKDFARAGHAPAPPHRAARISGRPARISAQAARISSLALCVFLLASSCARFEQFARKRADKAAYEIVAAKQTEALGQASPWTIDPVRDAATDRLLGEARRLDLSRDVFTTPSCLISLSDALSIAIANNRDYRDRKESLYAQALSLTETRRDYQPLFDASASAAVTRDRVGEPVGREQVEWYGSRALSAGANQLLATGARVSLDVSHSFVRFFTGEERPSSSNSAAFAITQPLLRGAGTLTAGEPLLQGERSMIYAVRDFRRFQQDFIIQAAGEYYDLLSANDQMDNARASLESANDNRNELERLAQGGRVSDIQVDQARQKVLEAEVRVSRARKAYSRQLDAFKIFLGLPIDLDLGPDPAELDRLTERGLLRPDMTLGGAIEAALLDRLDFKNQKDRVEDSRRAVRIAFRNFLPNLNAGYQFSTSTGEKGEHWKLDLHDNQHAWSLDLGLPFDWTPRRNDYRRALIGLEQAERSLNLAKDQLVLEVRDAWRELEESRTDYRIQLESVRLAERRVLSTSKFLQVGRAIPRDLLEAEDALLLSKNALTAALVRHTLQRLRFWNAVERLQIDETGTWIPPSEEIPDPQER